MEDHERLILLVPYRDGLVDVGTREGVCDNHILSRPLTKRWRCKDLSLPMKEDRQSLLTVRVRRLLFLSLSGTCRTNLAIRSELNNVM
ncbi:hypothetical protein AVEN_28933-1 [Araneus ventricosus]|uniref:Uncharacterized protein n=1 Tax=Araneus ventricosus TaxID=182803 RepID=A0A4Y2AJ41_ARAVE|nr:hypothetical protein AVEN_28933-1 [Araneus ventricosus]